MIEMPWWGTLVILAIHIAMFGYGYVTGRRDGTEAQKARERSPEYNREWRND